jgi:hypothetical protein
MTKTLLLVDFENVPNIDLSLLDDSVEAIVFVGANQNPPKASKKKATAHRFTRVDFQKVEGSGRNALDFHIAFHLGRTFETAPDTVCIVVAKDKGYDPLLLHLNRNGMTCRRVHDFAELVPKPDPEPASAHSERVVCRRCKRASTIEHHGGRWCTNCGSFASPPDPNLLPSLQPGYAASRSSPFIDPIAQEHDQRNLPECGWCYQRVDMTGGIYDDGEWMCATCIDRHTNSR